MKFLVDAQLPKSLAELFRRNGFDAIHTLELPNKNLTTDKEICRLADEEQRIVITKDSDFIQSHILSETPKKLIVVYTGNIKNSLLLEIFKQSMQNIAETLVNSDFIEVYDNKIVVHSNRQ